MYIKSDNLQTKQSKDLITKALLKLMESKQYNDITVTEICRVAEVVRQTFYRNFETKLDILDYYLENLFEEYTSKYLKEENDMYAQLKSFFDYSLYYKDFFLLIETNNLFLLLDKSITKNLENYCILPKVSESIDDSKLDMYVLGFISSTVCSILSLWVKNNFKESPEKLAQLARIFFSGLGTKATNFE